MKDVNREPKCIIIAAGDFPEVEIPVEKGDYVIACDAGLNSARRLGIFPDLIVGDFDSAREAGGDLLDFIAEVADNDPDRVLQLEVKKDDTDTLQAVRIGFSKGYRTFMLYGMLGGKRFDHSLANIQTLLFIKHHGGKGYVMSKECMMLVAENETVKFNRGNTGILSVFSLSEVSRGVTLKGLLYNMEEGELSNDFPLGVSNEFIIDEEAEVTVRDGTLLITVVFD
jgi:thiamine pyrophosphokinase